MEQEGEEWRGYAQVANEKSGSDQVTFFYIHQWANQDQGIRYDHFMYQVIPE